MRVPFAVFLLSCLLTCNFAFAGLEIETGGEATTDGPKIDVPNPTRNGSNGNLNDAQTGPLDEVLRFKNGDTLHGNLREINEDKMLTWIRPDILEPIHVTLENLRGTKLFKQRASAPEGARVELTNGDVLYGQLQSLTPDDLTLETWYAGQLTIPKVMVASLRPDSDAGGSILFAGPGKLEGWGYKNGNWERKGNRVTCHNGQLGRDLDLPDKVHIKVDVSWSGSYPSFSIITHTPDIRRYYNDCYNLQVQSSYFYLYRGSGSHNFGNHQFNKMRQMQNMKLELFVDKEEKNVTLFVNGDLVKQWTGLNYAPTGKGFMLISHGNYGPTTFANLRILRWDGKLPTKSAGGKAEKQDFVHFKNGDKMSGTLMNIQDDTVSLKPDFSDAIPIPVKRVGIINFAKANAERARRNKNDVEVFFPNGDHVTLEMAQLKEGKISGESENFGSKTFDLAAFVGIRFNIYDENATESNEAFKELLFQE